MPMLKITDKLYQFQMGQNGPDILVNIDQVCVIQREPKGTSLSFGRDHQISISTPFDDVVKALKQK